MDQKQIQDLPQQWEPLLQRAGEEILVTQANRNYNLHYKNEAQTDFATDADLNCEKRITHFIRQHYPSHKIHAEESEHHPIDPDEYTWVIDPIDGTQNFFLGLPYFGISVALAYQTHVLFGSIFLPATKQLFSAVKGQGATLNGQKRQCRIPENKQNLTVMLGTKQGQKKSEGLVLKMMEKIEPRPKHSRYLGASAVNLAYINANPHVLYFENSAFKAWDIAAGGIIVEESGLQLTDFNGKPWTVESESLFVAHPILHEHYLPQIRNIKEQQK